MHGILAALRRNIFAALIPNLVLDLDSLERVAIASGKVTSWTDTISNIAFTQATSANQPTVETSALLGGVQAVRFTEVNNTILTSAAAAALFPSAATIVVIAECIGETIYCLYETNPSTTVDCFWRYSDARGYMGAFRTARLETYPSVVQTYAPFPMDGANVFGVRSSGSAYSTFLNSSIATAQAAAYTAGTTHSIGGIVGSTTRHFNGRIVRVLGFSRYLTDAEVRVVVETARKLYGLVKVYTANYSAKTPGSSAVAGTSAPEFHNILRSSAAATVQTSASTVASSIGTNTLRYFSDGTNTGLLVEESTTNYYPQAHNQAGSGLTTSGATAPVSTNNTGPDGVADASRTTVVSGGFSNYALGDTVIAGSVTASEWLKHATGSGNFQMLISAGSNQMLTGTCNSTYKKVSITRSIAGAFPGLVPVDGRGTGGGTAQALDIITDFMQLEPLPYGTSAIITSGTKVVRAGDEMRVSAGPWYVDYGRMNREVIFRPFGSSSQYVGNRRIWTFDANNYCEFNATTLVLTIVIGGSSYSTPVSMSWAAMDLVSVFTGVGASITTNVQYRVNAGSAVVLSTGSPGSFGNITATATSNTLCNGTTQQMTGLLVEDHAYRTGHKPSWTV